MSLMASVSRPSSTLRIWMTRAETNNAQNSMVAVKPSRP